jgi:hypothetical protein
MLRFTFHLFSIVFICTALSGCLPKAVPYPYKDPEILKREASAISSELEKYIYGWLKGANSKNIPNHLLPPGINLQDNHSFYLQTFDEIDPKKQWLIRNSEEINFDSVKAGVPDPHVTYFALGTSLAPFGSKLVIEGEFPYCRFFSFQISPPFDGKGYCVNRALGPTEVSLVDTDIKPLPGSFNPFLPGANRKVKNRKYQVTFDLAIGDPVTLNPDFKPPYRGAGNNRVGGLIQNQGPLWKKLGGKGEWNLGLVWIRYYAPDKEKGSMAGVPIPKAYYVLPTGEKYFINSNFTGFEANTNKRQQAKANPPKEPIKSIGPEVGWGKSFGILRSLGEGGMRALNKTSPEDTAYIGKLELGATGRGEKQPAPYHYERSATENNYATYLGRSMNLGKNKVIILTGKLPTFPDTREGETTFKTSNLRYWSLTTYDYNPLRKTLGCAISSIMDDELILDQNRRYIIAYSRPEDRPKNATKQNGVTWVNWGPISDLGILLRWVSVEPEWNLPNNPHERNLPWAIASSSGSRYNPKLTFTNDHKGFLGECQPKVHYMTKNGFELLGNSLEARQIPDWRK